MEGASDFYFEDKDEIIKGYFWNVFRTDFSGWVYGQ